MRSGSDDRLAERLNRRFHRIFVLLILVVVVVNGFRPMMDNVDLGWHVAQGRWMLEHFAFYRADVLTYGNQGRAVIDEYPLFQVALFLAWKVGWWGPCLLTGLCSAFLFALLIRAARLLEVGPSSSFALALGLLLLYLQLAFPLRPHLVTYLGVIVFGAFLLQHRETTRWTDFWPLALFEIVWVNSHSGFVMGPALIALFGFEMLVRRIFRRALSWLAVRTWLVAFIFILLACFLNPYGAARFYLPFQQDQLESIRAYVGEMEPLNHAAGSLYQKITFLAALVVLVALFRRRGAVSYSFVFLAIVFYLEALSARKAWPLVGLFIPLILLSTSAFARLTITPHKRWPWRSAMLHFVVIIFLAMVVETRLSPGSAFSLRVLWEQFDAGRSELPVTATAWMRAHQIQGRLFHRCEDGGWLEQEGYDAGQVYADTGFGKYDDALIRKTGLVGDRPALLPLFLKKYQPDFVVCGPFSFHFPHQLRQDGWRLIFYSPNSSVWTKGNTRTDLPTVSRDQVRTAFDQDMSLHGFPPDMLLGRNLIGLQSMGEEDFVMTKMAELPAALHRTAWYWEAARTICFNAPMASTAHRQFFLQEANQLTAPDLTREFRAYAAYDCKDAEGARRLLEEIPAAQLKDTEAKLLLRIYIEQRSPRSLALANTSCFNLRDAEHWKYLAEAEAAAGHNRAAGRAWQEAVYYGPDDQESIILAKDFASRMGDRILSHQLDQLMMPNLLSR